MNFLWSSFWATHQVSPVLPNLLPSFHFFLYRSLSRRLVYFITFMPFCQPLFSLSAFFTLYFPFLISFCPFCFAPLFFWYKKWQLCVAQLSLWIVYYIQTKKLTEQKLCESLEAPPRFELGIKVLQTYALPLGYSAILERITRLELATSTLARWRSTRWAKSAFDGIYIIICKIPKPDT